MASYCCHKSQMASTGIRWARPTMTTSLTVVAVTWSEHAGVAGGRAGLCVALARVSLFAPVRAPRGGMGGCVLATAAVGPVAGRGWVRHASLYASLVATGLLRRGDDEVRPLDVVALVALFYIAPVLVDTVAPAVSDPRGPTPPPIDPAAPPQPDAPWRAPSPLLGHLLTRPPCGPHAYDATPADRSLARPPPPRAHPLQSHPEV